MNNKRKKIDTLTCTLKIYRSSTIDRERITYLITLNYEIIIKFKSLLTSRYDQIYI